MDGRSIPRQENSILTVSSAGGRGERLTKLSASRRASLRAVRNGSRIISEFPGSSPDLSSAREGNRGEVILEPFLMCSLSGKPTLSAEIMLSSVFLQCILVLNSLLHGDSYAAHHATCH
jgi:hypothetical protein